MRTPLGLLLVLVVLPAMDAPAQQAGQHRGLFLGFEGWGSPVVGAVGHVDPANRWTAYPTSPSGPWPHIGDVISATQDFDNRRVLVPFYNGMVNSTTPATYGLAAWDPATRAIVSTLWSAPYATATPRDITNITLNSDGDLVGFERSFTASISERLGRFDRRSATWQLLPGPKYATWSGCGGMEWDKLHGGFIHTTGTGEQILWRMTWDLKSTFVIASAFLNVRAWYGGGMLDTGEWVSSSRVAGTYMVVKPSTARWEHGPLTEFGVFTDCTPEKYAAPGAGYYAAFSAWHSVINNGIAYVDSTTDPHTIVVLVGGPYPNNVMSSLVMEVLPLHDRDLCTHRTGKATWAVNLDPGPGAFAGRPFVIAASLAGAAPPIALPDGRQVFLVPDGLTMLTARGALPPFLTGNVGVLNASGRASAKLDFSTLGTAANGTVVHLCAVVLDPIAPGGIGWVCDPWAFVVNVQP